MSEEELRSRIDSLEKLVARALDELRSGNNGRNLSTAAGNTMWARNPLALRTATIQRQHLSFDPLQVGFIYADGDDGDVTISVNTTLTRDMAYNSLTINTGIVLSPAGYRIFVKGTLVNNGTIQDNGANGVGNAGGAGAAAGTMGGGGSGGTGILTNGSSQGPGGSVTDGIGSAGGKGGDGTTWTGALAGTNTRVRANRHGMMILGDTANIKGGTGGGGGGGFLNTGSGGGGGGGGGVIIIGALVIDNRNGTIQCNGGNGANGSGNGSGGGGGGGGGGLVFVTSKLLSGIERTLAGTAGSPGSGGSAGLDGTSGTTIHINQL